MARKAAVVDQVNSRLPVRPNAELREGGAPVRVVVDAAFSQLKFDLLNLITLRPTHFGLVIISHELRGHLQPLPLILYGYFILL